MCRQPELPLQGGRGGTGGAGGRTCRPHTTPRPVCCSHQDVVRVCVGFGCPVGLLAEVDRLLSWLVG